MADDVDRVEARIRECKANPTPENLARLERYREERAVLRYMGGAYLLGRR